MNKEYEESLDLLEQITIAAHRAAGLTDSRTPPHCLVKRNAKLTEIAKYLNTLAYNLDREAVGVKLR
jgi:hypothetical protein